MIDAHTLAALMQDGEPAVSLYFPVAPDQRPQSGPQARMRDLLAQAEAALERHGLGASSRADLLAPARDEAAETGFAHHRDHGFALFLAPGLTPIRMVLPAPLPDAILVVGRRFHIKPLLAHMAREKHFHVLAISSAQARLYRATPPTGRNCRSTSCRRRSRPRRSCSRTWDGARRMPTARWTSCATRWS